MSRMDTWMDGQRENKQYIPPQTKFAGGINIWGWTSGFSQEMIYYVHTEMRQELKISKCKKDKGTDNVGI